MTLNGVMASYCTKLQRNKLRTDKQHAVDSAVTIGRFTPVVHSTRGKKYKAVDLAEKGLRSESVSNTVDISPCRGSTETSLPPAVKHKCLGGTRRQHAGSPRRDPRSRTVEHAATDRQSSSGHGWRSVLTETMDSRRGE